MKRVSLTLGRIGTVLLAMCLALAILIFIPPASFGITSSGMSILMPETFMFIGGPLSLNPQLFIKAELSTNTTIKFYIINLPREDAIKWVRIGNLTQFEEFIENNAEKVLLEETISSESATVEFTPGGIVNASFIVLNSDSHAAAINYKIELLASIAPKVRIIPAIAYLGPIGAILTGQWIFIKIKDRRKI
ncbi:MAG TPA: hypothetical protein ENF63_02050 [Candidatus Bathyarchaeota archaeon]|nr:hypothetical protein [Candidatus Bathyarchaeota archaeon]